MTDEPGSVQGGGGFTEFDFICTDKGQHRPYPLAKVMVRPGSDDFIAMSEHSSFRPAGRESMFGGAPGFDDIFCAECRRNVRRNHAKLVEVVQRLRQLGITVLDISWLPF